MITYMPLQIMTRLPITEIFAFAQGLGLEFSFCFSGIEPTKFTNLQTHN